MAYPTLMINHVYNIAYNLEYFVELEKKKNKKREKVDKIKSEILLDEILGKEMYV